MDDDELDQLDNEPVLNFMTRKNISAVIGIEHQCFESPWSIDEFDEFLLLPNASGAFATVRGITTGFVMYRRFPEYIAIENLAVGLDWQRCGIGRKLVGKTIELLNTSKKQTAVICILSEVYVESQMFLKAMGFKCSSKWKPSERLQGDKDRTYLCFAYAKPGTTIET